MQHAFHHIIPYCILNWTNIMRIFNVAIPRSGLLQGVINLSIRIKIKLVDGNEKLKAATRPTKEVVRPWGKKGDTLPLSIKAY